jgi:hypothetical protein
VSIRISDVRPHGGLKVTDVALRLRRIGFDASEVRTDLRDVGSYGGYVSADLVKAVLGLGPMLREIGPARSDVGREGLNGGEDVSVAGLGHTDSVRAV